MNFVEKGRDVGVGQPFLWQNWSEKECHHNLFDYENCIKAQNKEFKDINKFKCLNEIYEVEKHCPKHIISTFSHTLRKNLEVEKNFTEREIKYLNFKANYGDRLNAEETKMLLNLKTSSIQN